MAKLLKLMKIKNKSNKSYLSYTSYSSYVFYKTYFVLFVLLFSFFIAPAKPARAATLSRPPSNLGLVGYWPMDEGAGPTAGDFSGNGNTGTLFGTPTWANGRHGKAISLSNNSYVRSSNFSGTSVLKTGSETATWTFSVWAKQIGTNGNENIIMGKQGCNSGIYSWSGGYAFAIKTTSCWTNAKTIATVPTDMSAWHHLVAVYNNRTMSFYADGVLVGSDTFSDTIYAHSGNFGIGGESGVYDFNGLIDDARVYNRALSATEISKLYSSGQTTVKKVSEQGLVGYWALNDGAGSKAGDNSGNGIIGTLSAISSIYPTWTDGKKGKALNFDGSSGYVQINTSSKLASSEITFSAWVKGTATTAAFNRILSWNDHRFEIAQNGTSLAYYDGSWRVISGANLLGTWNHVLVTRGINSHTVYFNGTQVYSSSSATITTDNGPAYIGKQYSNTTENFQGLIDDVRIYNRALSATEIQSLYKQNETMANAPQNNKLTNGLVGLWSFNGKDVSGTTAYDRSGQGNNGTITGAKLDAGKVGQAIKLNGSTDWVRMGTNTYYTFNKELTVSAWVKFDAFNYILSQAEYNNDFMTTNVWLWHQAANGFIWYVNDSGTWRNISTGGLVTNRWYLITTTINDTNSKIYIDGVEVASGSGITTQIKNVATSEIGTNDMRYATTRTPHAGFIDEVRVYNRALSASEIKQLYNLGK